MFEPYFHGYNVYIKVNEIGAVISINSSAFIHDFENWILLEENVFGDRGHHAQGNYFEKSLIDFEGCHNYYYIDNAILEATPEQKAAEKAGFPKPGPSPMETLQQKNHLLEAQVQALSTQQAFIEDCLIEVGQVVYA